MQQLVEWEKGRDGLRNLLAKSNLNVQEESHLIGLLRFTAADVGGETAFALNLRYGETSAEATATELLGKRRGEPVKFSWRYGDRRALQAWVNHVEGLARRYHVEPPAPNEDDLANAIQSLIEARPDDAARIVADALGPNLDRDALRAFVATMEEAATASPDGP